MGTTPAADLGITQPTIKHSFYKNEDGVVHGLSPWRLVDYWTWTRSPDPANFVMN